MRVRPTLASRKRLLDVANANHVVGFIPQQVHVDIAVERTEGMVEYFWAAARRMTAERSMVALYEYTQRLANSCYLQGVNDAAYSMAQTGMMKEELSK
jgi:hypothetical protein